MILAKLVREGWGRGVRVKKQTMRKLNSCTKTSFWDQWRVESPPGSSCLPSFLSGLNLTLKEGRGGRLVCLVRLLLCFRFLSTASFWLQENSVYFHLGHDLVCSTSTYVVKYILHKSTSLTYPIKYFCKKNLDIYLEVRDISHFIIIVLISNIFSGLWRFFFIGIYCFTYIIKCFLN